MAVATADEQQQQGAPGDAGWSFSFEDNPLWKLKVYLQFTGWLQYVISLVLPGIVFLLSRIEALLFGSSRVLLPASQLLLVFVLLDVVFIKFGWAPPEPLPKSRSKARDGNEQDALLHDDKDLNLLELIMSRHSCRSFQRRPLIDEHKDELLKLIEHYSKETLFDKPIRLEFTTKPLTVWPTVNAQQFIVALTCKEYSKYAIMDVGRCLEKIVIQAQGRMGLSTCWIGPGADHQSIIRELDIDPSKYHPFCVCAVGYKSIFIPLVIRLMNAKISRTRLPLDKLFFRDAKCTIPLDINEDPAFVRMEPAFEACRWSPSSYNAQTTCAVVVVDNKRKAWTRLDFCRTKNSKYYATVALGIWQSHWEMACKQLGVKGRFVVDETLEKKSTEVPLYDVSWVFDKPIPLSKM